jgi:hypothetical protein
MRIRFHLKSGRTVLTDSEYSSENLSPEEEEFVGGFGEYLGPFVFGTNENNSTVLVPANSIEWMEILA